MVQKKYEVRLSSEEKRHLRKVVRSGRSSAQAITRARILLKVDEGRPLRWQRPWTSRSGR